MGDRATHRWSGRRPFSLDPLIRSRVRPTLLLLLLWWSLPPGALGQAMDSPVRADAAVLRYRSDAVGIRLAPRAAERVRTESVSAGTRERELGIPALDQVAARLGEVWFEPEFAGGTTSVGPVASHVTSDAADFDAFWIVHLPQAVSVDRALTAFGASSEVVNAFPIAIVPACAVPND